jgi:hypothetical protein
MTDPDQLYRLVCPHCGGSELVIRKDDMEEDEFIGDPLVGCLKCQAMLHLSALVPEESSYGQILHIERR